ncbi:MAG: hypothetical protein J6R41_10705 [Paludibacteraceae bacterium]|nr:hypothetical protein [Paludibacteraceae bacterium]
MATINVYECYYKASLVVNGDERQGALVMLISTSEEGQIRYEAAVTFFPHRNDEDYAISYDAYFSKVLYEAKGRRSKKREAALLQELQQHIDEIADNAGGKVFWNSPLREARLC